MTLDEAQGLAELELWDDAWQALDELPPEDQLDPRVIRLRLECAIGMERWNTVMELAGHLSRGDDQDRLAAAAGFRLLAVVAIQSRHIDTAKDLVARAIEAWPDSRRDMEDDPELAEHVV